MNRLDLQQLAEDRIADAEALLDSGRWSAAYYSVGYAVECALRACIAKQTNLHDFPDKQKTFSAHTHNLAILVKLALLEEALAKERTANTALYGNWQLVKDWSEQARYEPRREDQARDLCRAVTETIDFVPPWIKKNW